MKNRLLVFYFLLSTATFAQVGIGTNTPDASAMLEVKSSNKGFLPPRVALTSSNSASPVTFPSAGLLVYNTAAAGTTPYDVSPGYYYWSGAAWFKLAENNSTKIAAFVNRGVDVTLGNLKVRVSASGNASLQVSTVTGTYIVYGSDVYVAGGTGSTTISDVGKLTITTTPAYLNAGLHFIIGGYTDTWTIMDPANNIAWRISVIFGAGYFNNLITIERLL
jgi:hypothetical protein